MLDPVADPGLKTCGAKLVDFKLINTIYSGVQYRIVCMLEKAVGPGGPTAYT
jgi:hypothetical protein